MLQWGNGLIGLNSALSALCVRREKLLVTTVDIFLL
jgi:hypothetical protein